MPSTTDICLAPGVYQTDCVCHRRIALAKGEIYPRCLACRRPITWTRLEPRRERRSAWRWAIAWGSVAQLLRFPWPLLRPTR